MQVIRNAVRAFKQVDCSDPKAVFKADSTTSKSVVVLDGQYN